MTRPSLAAADGFRLAVHRTNPGSPVDPKATVIIPARTFNELNRLLGEQEEPVEITINQQKSQLLFCLKNAELVSQVIPQSYNTRAVVDTAEFLRVTNMCSIFARDASGIVRLVITPGAELAPGKLTISAQAEEIGGNVSEIDALVDGQEAKIAFNVKYLSDVLSVLRQSQILTKSGGTLRINPLPRSHVMEAKTFPRAHWQLSCVTLASPEKT